MSRPCASLRPWFADCERPCRLGLCCGWSEVADGLRRCGPLLWLIHGEGGQQTFSPSACLLLGQDWRLQASVDCHAIRESLVWNCPGVGSVAVHALPSSDWRPLDALARRCAQPAAVKPPLARRTASWAALLRLDAIFAWTHWSPAALGGLDREHCGPHLELVEACSRKDARSATAVVAPAWRPVAPNL